jgi:ABC-type phosphate transport system substrate-binding protein
MNTIRSFSLAVAILTGAAAARADVVVVVNPHNPVAGLSAEQVTQIYTGTSTAFPGGAAATPLDQPEGSPAREEFLAKVVDKSAAQFKAIWSRLIFSGKGTRPKTVGSNDDMKKAVAADPAAIGFIERSALDASVKPVLTVK